MAKSKQRKEAFPLPPVEGETKFENVTVPEGFPPEALKEPEPEPPKKVKAKSAGLPVELPRYATVQDGLVRRFKDPALQAAVDKAITAGAQGKKLAVVATADLEGASLSIVCRVGDSWSVMAGGYKKWSGQIGAEAQIVFTPF